MVKYTYIDNKKKTNYASNFSQKHKDCIAYTDFLFSKKQPLLSLWQEIAEQFYPERADFTVTRGIGNEFADHLTTSYPLLIRRDLGNSLASMLRPTGTTWAHITTDREDRLDLVSRAWLEAKTKVLFRAMTDPVARFSRATNEADHDFATFGQAAISLEVNRAKATLLYRTWHLRDMVWAERHDGSIGIRCRKWKPTARDLIALFPNTVHGKVKELADRGKTADLFREIEVRHIVIPAEDYDIGKKAKFPFISLYVDMENKHIMEEMPIATGYYIIPRWQTVSGSQYAHSPATVVALPDARLLQAINFTLLKAGEKAVDPPMIATQEMIKSPIDIQPGGVTWVDADYDERSGEVLRPMTVDSKGIPIGLNMQDRIQQLIMNAFYIDKLQLPPSQREMTAYEVSKRLQEYIRQAMPLFGPIENEYNAPLCEATFTHLLLNGAFGAIDDIPEAIQGANVRFRFESPLVQAEDEQLMNTFQDTANLLALAAQLDPNSVDVIDPVIAIQDTLRGRQVPTKWFRDDETRAAMAAQKQQQMEQAQQLQMAQAGADVAKTAGEAQQTMMPSK